MHRARLDRSGPSDAVGGVDEDFCSVAIQLDRSDARIRLPLFLIDSVLLPEAVAGLQLQRHAIPEVTLLLVEALPFVQSDDDGNLRIVKARIDAKFCVLLPVQVE